MKKTALIHILFLFTLLIISSCESEKELDFKTATQKKEHSYPLKISPDEAIQIAYKAVDDISQNTRTLRSINSIELIKGKNTRGGHNAVPDSALYIINFENNEGFALVAADRRLRPFYAVSDEGHLNLADTATNKGLADVLNNIYAETVCYMDTFPNVGGVIGWNPGVLPDKPITSGYIKDIHIRPLLNANVRNGWHQGSSFNKYCFTKSGEPAKVGCVAIATAMIMSYYEWPQTISGRNLNWSEMKYYSGSDDLYFILRELGKSHNLDMNYGKNESSAFSKNIPRTFRNFDYHKPEDPNSFSTAKAVKTLDTNNSPFIIVGDRYDKETGGHAWVIDGVIGYKSDGTVQYPNGVTTYTRYFHCCWGWGGSCNGYYYFLQGIAEGNPIDYDETDTYRYQANLGGRKYYNFSIITNFKPY